MSMLDQYDEMLDDCHGDVDVAGMKFSTSRALKELDPTAYRCGFNDWLDAEGEEAQKRAEDDGSFDHL